MRGCPLVQHTVLELHTSNITLITHVVVQCLNYATASPSSYVQAQIFSPSLHVKSTCFFGMPCIKKTFVLPHTSKSSLSVPSGIA